MVPEWWRSPDGWYEQGWRHLRNLSATPGGYNHFIEEYKNLRFNCSSECFSSEPPSYCEDYYHRLHFKNVASLYFRKDIVIIICSVDQWFSTKRDGAVWTWDTEYHSMKIKKCHDKPNRPAGGDAREGNIPFYTQLALLNKYC